MPRILQAGLWGWVRAPTACTLPVNSPSPVTRRNGCAPGMGGQAALEEPVELVGDGADEAGV
jgi:hypothetical protein